MTKKTYISIAFCLIGLFFMLTGMPGTGMILSLLGTGIAVFWKHETEA